MQIQRQIDIYLGQKETADLYPGLACGLVQRGELPQVHRVHVRPVVDQKLGHLDRQIDRQLRQVGKINRQRIYVQISKYLRYKVIQIYYRPPLSLAGRCERGRPSFPLTDRQIGRLIARQIGASLEVSVGACVVKGDQAALVLCVHVRAVLEQQLNNSRKKNKIMFLWLKRVSVWCGECATGGVFWDMPYPERKKE